MRKMRKGFTLVELLIVIAIIGALSAVMAFSSADSALTSLTTCYCVDIRHRLDDERLRKRTHIAMCLFFVLFILLFRYTNTTSLIDAVYILVSYTYGPLLGLFAFGLFTRQKPCDRMTPYICITSPLLCLALDIAAQQIWGYRFGYELLMLNGLFTFTGLFMFRK